MRKLKVCYVVCTNRPQFAEWYQWNYDKQSYRADQRELIVVDGCDDLADARTQGVLRCDGDVIAFADDDDWEHPHRLEILASLYNPMFEVVGSQNGYFVDIETGRFICAHRTGGPHFNGAMYSLEIARQTLPVQWGGRDDAGNVIKEAEDVYFMVQCEMRAKGVGMIRFPLHFWGCHTYNMCNKSGRHDFGGQESILPQLEPVDPDLPAQLELLRQRLRRAA